MAESISIEETNALREKLGLPPLAQDAEQPADPDQEAFDNYQKKKEQDEKEAKAEEIRARIEKSKNRKKHLEKLQGKGLGEASEGTDDALDWVKKSRQRQRERELAKRRAREQDEMDETFQEYDASALSGLKVAHELTEFNEGSEMILTLKDRGILDEDDEQADELSNIQLEERERLRKNLDAKKKKPGYNPYDDEEFTLGGAKKSILPQYEEEAKAQGFAIGQNGAVQIVSEEEKKKRVAEKLKEQTLDYEKMQEIKDYYTQDEVNLSFKKPKKKKKKNKLRKRTPDEDISIDSTPKEESDTTTTTATEPAPRKTIDVNANFVDDDELQQALSRTRRAANKQKSKLAKKMTPEDIARSIAEQRESATPEENEPANEGQGLVLSEMTEFVNALGETPAFTTREPPTRTAKEPTTDGTSTQETRTRVEEKEATPIEEEETTTPKEEVRAREASPAASAAAPEEKMEEENTAIIEEPLVSRGLAATLSLLSQKGIVSKPTEEQVERDRIAADRLKWIAEQKKKDLQREREREYERQRQRERDGSSRGIRDRERQREREREREREKEMEEREQMREFEKRMENYRPDVKLEYVDEYGHQMDTKEAFRYMSHKFHGKTSGKAKTEKRMQKLEEELKLNMMSSSDTPLNLATKLLERQQRTGSAHVVLSVGNRGVAAPASPGGSDVIGSSSSKRARSEDLEQEPSKKRR
ncbi:sart-1 protein [Lichtheimia corymbifera JMRC:FSU:9682]|uniref:Sart-1 protein n=1 Tax=Lichtheimia corymbifera JMRC:FSU:9682 TaxID=1263082 RepID=A0A068RXQ7_9FUNG|nr:sart-1 protein [Lichtheimia corymbifera JMRC:FSU:9682]